MSLIKKVGRKIVYGLGIKKVPVMTKVEQCRAEHEVLRLETMLI